MKTLFKKYFVAGTIVFVPIVGTIWILKAIILWADNVFVSLLPRTLLPDFLHRIPGVGLVLTLFTILLMGAFTRLYLGKRIVSYGDLLFSKVPFGRAIYQGIKQLLSAVFMRGEGRFSRVVMVEYPKEGSYAIGFVTGRCDERTVPKKGEDFLCVFVPTTPNPTSGFLLIIPEEKIIPMDMSVEEATKLVISGGLVTER